MQKSVPMSAAVAAALDARADAAGRAAAEAVNPVPMVVQQHASPFNDNSPVVKEYFVADGVCGFGWVEVRPARGGFASYLKASGRGRYSEYGRYMRVSVPLRSQSLARNEAYARSYAAVLKEAGVDAYGNSRID